MLLYQRMNLKWLIPIAVFAVLIIWFFRRSSLTAKVKINDRVYSVDLAVTPIEKMKGLSGRESLADDHGMLFLYDHKEQYSFWMKGMKFPLDFVWIDGNQIVDITQNVLPPENPLNIPVVKPNKPVDKILELNAGTIRHDAIAVGDSVAFIDR